MLFDILGLGQNRAEYSGIHDKDKRSKHRTLGDSKKEFDGIGPDGRDLNGLETMFKVANHPRAVSVRLVCRLEAVVKVKLPDMGLNSRLSISAKTDHKFGCSMNFYCS